MKERNKRKTIDKLIEIGVGLAVLGGILITVKTLDSNDLDERPTHNFKHTNYSINTNYGVRK